MVRGVHFAQWGELTNEICASFAMLFGILEYSIYQEADSCNERNDSCYFQRRSNIT